MTTQSNSNSDILANNFASAKNGATFTGLVITKVGELKGRGADRKLFGNDQVHVTVVTGFSYASLVQRSLDQLDGMTDQEVLDSAAKKGVTLTLDEVTLAREELRTSFQASLAGENVSTTEDVFESLVVDGESVKGGRVYRCKKLTGAQGTCYCRDCSGDASAPLEGTIYLQGLKVNETVLVAAPNGPAPAPKSAPKTVAKNILRSRLPISKYVSYRLEPGTSFMLRVGGTAVAAASAEGLDFTKVGELIARCG